jgi:hypothetical protein
VRCTVQPGFPRRTVPLEPLGGRDARLDSQSFGPLNERAVDCARALAVAVEEGAQEAGGVRALGAEDVGRRAHRDDAAAGGAAFGAEVDDPVGFLDDVEVVLDGDDRVVRDTSERPGRRTLRQSQPMSRAPTSAPRVNVPFLAQIAVTTDPVPNCVFSASTVPRRWSASVRTSAMNADSSGAVILIRPFGANPSSPLQSESSRFGVLGVPSAFSNQPLLDRAPLRMAPTRPTLPPRAARRQIARRGGPSQRQGTSRRRNQQRRGRARSGQSQCARVRRFRG